MGRNKLPSQRQLRVGELVRHTLAAMLTRSEIHDPVLERTAVTVSEVAISPDLRKATAYVVPLGGAGTDEVLHALNRARKYIRGRIAGEVQLRNSPEIFFKLDKTFDYSDKIGKLLHSPKVAPDLD